LDTNEPAPKRHLDRFSRFCTAQPYAQHTDTQTTLRATPVAIGCIYALMTATLTFDGSRVIYSITFGTVMTGWGRYQM